MKDSENGTGKFKETLPEELSRESTTKDLVPTNIKIKFDTQIADLRSIKLNNSYLGMATTLDKFSNMIKTPEYLQAMRLQAKTIQDSIAPAVQTLATPEYMQTMQLQMETIKNVISPIVQAMNTPEYLQKIQSHLLLFSSVILKIVANYKFNFNYLDNFRKVFSGIAEIIAASNHYNLTTVFERLGEVFDFDKRKRSEKIYLNTMYESQWVPYFRTDSAHFELYGIFEIVARTRTASKSRKNQIDTFIFTTYNKAKMNSFKKEWRAAGLDYGVKKLLCQAIDCYNDKKYGLTVAAITPLWERIITQKANKSEKFKGDDIKECFITLTDYNDMPDIINQFYSNFIMGTCYSLSESSMEYPKRNAVSHGWFEKYPTRKMALNAILFTDLLLSLDVIKTGEE